MPVKLAESTDFMTLEMLIPSWELSLRAANKSPKTIRSYGDSARLLEAFAREKFGIVAVDRISRDVVESFTEDQLAHWKPATAAVRYRSVQQLMKWLLEEGEIKSNPMEHTKPPKVAEVLVPVVSDDDLKKLLKACGGKAFEDKRDLAILRVFIDTGIRLAECAGIKLKDVEESTIYVTGKGNRPRPVSIGSKSQLAVDSYIRLRRLHPRASSTALWLSPKGGLTASGITQILKRRCAQAEIEKIHPHQLRHTFAHTWLAEGGRRVISCASPDGAHARC